MHRPRSRVLVPVMALTGGIAVTGVTLAAAAHVYRRVRHDLPMIRSLDGTLRFVAGPTGAIAFYSGGQSRRLRAPILLIHDTGPVACSADLKPIWDYFSATRRVISIDLPGFGFSDRGDQNYTAETYRDAILTVMGAAAAGEPVDIVALGQGAEFAALAAILQPKLARSITLLSPTGLIGSSRQWERLFHVLRRSALAQIVFDLITSRPVLRVTSGQGATEADRDELLGQHYETSHQQGAWFAPAMAALGLLSTPKMVDSYETLAMPALAIFGSSEVSKLNAANVLNARSNWHIHTAASPGTAGRWLAQPAVLEQISHHVR